MADSPVAGAGKAFKRVPKWAWVASGGVIIGVFAMRRLKGGGKSDATEEDMSTQADSTFPSSTALFPSSGIVTPQDYSSGGGGYYSDGGSSGIGASDLIDLVGRFTDAQAAQMGSIQDYQAEQARQQGDAMGQILAAISAMGNAAAGGAPSSDTTGTTYAEAFQAAAKSPPAATPKATGSTAQKSTSSCSSKYPFKSNRGCYQVVCQAKDGTKLSKGKWHAYSDGKTYIKVANSC